MRLDPVVRSKRLEVILKIAERCNLDCSYCYFFYGGDESFKKHPAIIPMETVDKLAAFLEDAIYDLKLTHIQVDFHGGEPMMTGARRFREICETLVSRIGNKCSLTLAIQTNATLITEEWCQIFSEYQVNVGVSLDGERSINDRFRVDHAGNGSYDSAVSGIRLLQKWIANSKLATLTVLSVANLCADPDKQLKHFVDDLGFERIDFLLPDYTHDSVDWGSVDDFGSWYAKLFDSWLAYNNPRISIRFLRSLTSLLVGGPSLVVGTGSEPFFAVTIGSDGGLNPDDTLRSCGGELYHSGYDVHSHSLKEYIRSEKYSKILQQSSQAPDACRECRWLSSCGGGSPVNRWKAGEEFTNKTVFCGAMKDLLSHIDQRITVELST